MDCGKFLDKFWQQMTKWKTNIESRSNQRHKEAMPSSFFICFHRFFFIKLTAHEFIHFSICVTLPKLCDLNALFDNIWIGKKRGSLSFIVSKALSKEKINFVPHYQWWCRVFMNWNVLNLSLFKFSMLSLLNIWTKQLQMAYSTQIQQAP